MQLPPFSPWGGWGPEKPEGRPPGSQPTVTLRVTPEAPAPGAL